MLAQPIIWNQKLQNVFSVIRNKLPYTELFSDGGDSKSYVSVKYTYGRNFKVEKKEYVRHVQKRVGCYLWNLKECYN